MCVYYNPILLDGFGLKNYNYFNIMHNVRDTKEIQQMYLQENV